MPYYQTQFDSPQGINTVVVAIEHFSADRFFSALSQKKNMHVADINNLNANILSATAKLQSEYANLQKFALTFNNQFVTYNNKYFETATILLRKLKTSSAQLKAIFRRFTPNSSASVPSQLADNSPRLIYENSPLSSTEYTPVLFQEHFVPEVQSLYQNMATFFNLMEEAIEFCKDILVEEEGIRKDGQQCNALFHDFKDSHHRHIKSIVKCISTLSDEFAAFNNSAILLRESTNSDEEFSQKGFHNLEYNDVCDLLTKEIYEEIRHGEYSKDELFLFPDNKSQIYQVRYMITHFDEYLEKKFSTHKKLPAKYIACLLKWAGPKEDKAFVQYFKDYYLGNGGQHQVPSNASVNVEKKKLSDTDPLWRKLNVQWNNINI